MRDIWVSKEKQRLEQGALNAAPEVTQGSSGDGERRTQRPRLTGKESCGDAPKAGPKAVGSLGRGQTGRMSHRKHSCSTLTIMGSRETNHRQEREESP